MTFADRARRRRRAITPRRSTALATFSLATLAAIGVAQSGCILFEDPSEIEGIDVTISDDTSTPGDTSDDTTIADTSLPDGTVGDTSDDLSDADADDTADGDVAMMCPAACGANAECTDPAVGCVCTSGFADCDGDPGTGCEQAESFSACGAACLDCSALDHVATASCNGGCVIELCEAGWADCNGMASDGCEATLQDTACGAGCGTDCTALDNVEVGKCAGASCALAACAPGWMDVNGDASDGCEQACAAGECWTELPYEFVVLAAEAGGQTGLVGSTEGRVYFTDDAGRHWYPRQSPFDDTILDLDRDGALAAAIVASETNRVAVSTDLGLNWSELLLPVATGSGPLRTVVVDDGRILVAGDGRLAVSSDAGATWTNLIGGLPGGTNVRAVIFDGDLLLVGTAAGEAFLSTDAGATFAPVDPPASGQPVAFMVADGSTIYAGGAGFLVSTTDNGLTWTAVPDLPATVQPWTAMAVEGDLLVLVAGNEYAIRRMADEPFELVTITEAVAAPTELLTGAWIQNGEAVLVGHQSRFGHTFVTDATADEMAPPYVRLELQHEERQIRWVVEAEDTVLVGGRVLGSATEALLLRSIDDGLTFAPVNPATASPLVLASLPTPEEGIIAGGLGEVVRTLDTNAEQWATSLQGQPIREFRDIAYDADANFALLGATVGSAPTVFIGYLSDASAGTSVGWLPVTCAFGSAVCPLDQPLGTTYINHVALSGSSAIIVTDLQEMLLGTDFDETTQSTGTWTPLPDITTEPIVDLVYDGTNVTFFTNNGVVSRIWHSADQGMTWLVYDEVSMMDITGPVFDGTGDPLAEPVIPDLSLRAWAWDGATAVAVGDASGMARTTDNGATWTRIALPEMFPSVNLTHVVTAGEVIIALGTDTTTGATTVVYSSDAGVTLETTTIDLRGFPVRDLSYDAGRVLLVAPHGQVLRSVAP